MFERFTPDARRVIVLAQEEARTLSHNFIGTEHLLLGLLSESDGVGARALAAQSIDLDACRAKVAELVAPTEVAGAHIPFTPNAKKAFEACLREAVRMENNWLGTEHLLLGVVAVEGTGRRVIEALGSDVDAIRIAVTELAQIARGATGTDGAYAVSMTTHTTVSAQGLPEQPLAPACPHCGAALEEVAMHRTLSIPDEEPDGDAMRVTFLFCGACGKMLGSSMGGAA